MLTTQKICDRHKIFPDIREYTENTTIHGIKYLGEKRRPLGEKCFWIIIFIFCFTILGVFLHDLVEKWSQQSVILVEDVESTPIFDVPFPAVTICPQFKIKPNYFDYKNFSQMANKTIKEGVPFEDPAYIRKFELAQQVCSYENVKTFRRKYAAKLNLSYLTEAHIDLLWEITPHISEIMTFAKFHHERMHSDQEHNTLFSPILTNEGVCFTFNVPSEIIRTEKLHNEYPYYNIVHTIKGWDYETGYYDYPSFPRISWAIGAPNSLKISLAAFRTNLYTSCQPTNLGYKIMLHSPAIYPSTFVDYIPIHHETITKIKVIPKIITTSPKLRNYSPNQRQCYFNDERKLQFFKFYNKANCKLECFANYTLAKYKCVHYSFPRNNKTLICGANIDFQQLYAKGENIKSWKNFNRKFPDKLRKLHVAHHSTTATDDVKLSCDCLPECNAIEYQYTLETENYEYEKQFTEPVEILPVNVDIYWSEATVTGYTRKQLYTFSDLVSNFGGLLGLFIGASILSVFEILYFCVIRQFTKCFKSRKHSIDLGC